MQELGLAMPHSDYYSLTEQCHTYDFLARLNNENKPKKEDKHVKFPDPQIEVTLINEDDLKNEDKLKNKDDF